MRGERFENTANLCADELVMIPEMLVAPLEFVIGAGFRLGTWAAIARTLGVWSPLPRAGGSSGEPPRLFSRKYFLTRRLAFVRSRFAFVAGNPRENRRERRGSIRDIKTSGRWP